MEGTGDLSDGLPVLFADTLSNTRSITLRSLETYEARSDVAYPHYWVEGLEPEVAPPDGSRVQVGYWATTDDRHAPFRQMSLPIAVSQWDELLANIEEPEPDSLAQDFHIRAWTASVGGAEVTLFEVQRQGDLHPGCPPLFRFFGIVDSSTGLAKVVNWERGDCEGKGGDDRTPHALIERGGRLFVLIALLGWGFDGRNYGSWTVKRSA